MHFTEFVRHFQVLTAQVEQSLLGKRDQVRRAVTCLLAGGHLLLDDVPGVGKTTLAAALAGLVRGGRSTRIQGTPDLLPGDILGVSVFERDHGGFTFHDGPIVANVVLFDEINRCAPRTQSALLQAMQERRVTTFRHDAPLPDPFMVIGTQNPQETLGTYPLPEAQLDRFLMRITLGYPDRDALRELLRRHGRRPGPAEDGGITPEGLRVMIETARAVPVSDAVYDYVCAIVEATRTAPDIALGASPRASLDLLAAAKVQALARITGAEDVYLRPDDVRAVAADVLAHRLVLNGRDGRPVATGQREAVGRILDTVPVS
ncbi:AAA family ATPase [Catenuloplanes sp. NPDC051500]|uniref:AAA family ATPase n=1 Tax=Catenuloplanes sp. NPDC051500 TaxID=3363959 RepID=UPI0037B68A4F